MESRIDFLKCLETDMVLNIFKCLDDPADLIRASIVSRDWRDFGRCSVKSSSGPLLVVHEKILLAYSSYKGIRENVLSRARSIIALKVMGRVRRCKKEKQVIEEESDVTASALSKQLCVGLFPQLAYIANVTEPNCKETTSTDVGSSKSMEWEIANRDHKAYASLLQALMKLKSSPVECITEAFSASSTDNYPDESIVNTLDPRDRFSRRASYWSSKGQKDPSVPETLIYRLKSDLCVITEIDIQPFEAFFQSGDPIYSAKSVRFRMGHPKSITEIESYECFPFQQPADDKFIWTYTSPEFTMTQENRLQHFNFPEPVLCVGGFLQIELSGRVQRQEMDGLFYICVSHVKVLGRPLSPAFHVEILEPSGKFILKYFPDALHHTLQISSNGKEPEPAPPVRLLTSEEMLWGRGGLLRYLVGGDQEDDDAIDSEEEENEMDRFIL